LELDLRQIIRLGRRWWWLFLLAPLVAGFTARIFLTRNQVKTTPFYVATATLLINPIQSTGRLNYSLTTYSELLLTKPVLETALADVDLPFDAETLRSRVSSEPVLDQTGRSTELLRIRALDTEPQRAATIANAVARAFVDYIGEQALLLTGPTRETLDDAITATEQQIAQAEQDIADLQLLPGTSDASQQAQLSALRDYLNGLRESLSQLLLTGQAMDLEAASAQSRVTFVDEATVPAAPLLASRGIDPTLPAAFAGFILAGAIVLLLGYLDNSVRTAEAAANLVAAPVLSRVPRLARIGSGARQLFVVERPQTVAADAILRLRTNVESTLTPGKPAIIGISSPGTGEGKSTITANLGASLARGGLRVVIVDTNFRHPSQHEILGGHNDQGLSSLLLHPNMAWHPMLERADAVENLTFIPSGPSPSNPAELIARDRFSQLLGQVSKTVDVTLVDMSPVLTVSDTAVIAPMLDGIILVCRASRTRRGALRAAAAALRQSNGRILGVVMNQQVHNDESHDYPIPPGSDPLRHSSMGSSSPSELVMA